MRLPILIVSLFFYYAALGQRTKSIGISFGIPIVREHLPEGRQYQPFTLLGYYPIADLLKNKNKNDHLIWYVEPQLVIVSFSPNAGSEFEFGVNLGIQYQFQLFQKTYLTAAIGSGPHFITVETRQQSKGFIFSDNFEAGLKRTFEKQKLNLNLRLRFRHISNAGLDKPNKGIDTWFLVAGAEKTF